MEERAFERAQGREVIAHLGLASGAKASETVAAIEEDRALALEMAAFEHAAPPEGRK